MTAQHAKHRSPIILTAIAVVLALIVAGVGIFVYLHIANKSSEPTPMPTIESYKSPYDFANLTFNENDRPTYTVDGEIKSQVGVDVSSYQGAIDWSAVAADGIGFAFIRLGNRGTTEGGLFVDDAYNTNVTNAQAAGLEVGVYFYSQATTVEEAQEEAAFVLQQLGGRYLELPVVFDHESLATDSRANDVDYKTLTAAAEAFCSAIEAGGYETMLYGNAYDLNRYSLIEVSGGSYEGCYAHGSTPKRATWLAEYDSSEPSAQFDFAIWQYSNSGSVSGIGTAVDMNIWFKL